MTIVTVGIDLAKNVFAVHGVDEGGKPALVRPEVPRAKLLELIADLPPCLIGVAAFSGAHHKDPHLARLAQSASMPHPLIPRPTCLAGCTTKAGA